MNLSIGLQGRAIVFYEATWSHSQVMIPQQTVFALQVTIVHVIRHLWPKVLEKVTQYCSHMLEIILKCKSNVLLTLRI